MGTETYAQIDECSLEDENRQTALIKKAPSSYDGEKSTPKNKSKKTLYEFGGPEGTPVQ
jgi:hypothetical protein